MDRAVTRALALTLALLAPVCAEAGSVAMMCGGGVPMSATAMCPAADASLACETFDTATGYDLTWTEGGVGGSSTIDEDAAHVETFLCDTSTEMLTMTRNGTETLTTSTTHSEATTAYYDFFVYITSSAISNNGGVEILYAYDGAAIKWTLALRKDAGGNYFYRFGHRNNANSLVTDDTGTITASAWHEVEVKWVGNQASGGWAVTVDGGALSVGDSGTASASYSLDKFELRANTNNMVYSVDNLKIHTSAPICN